MDVLCILSSDLKDGVDSRIEMRRAGGVRGDFIKDVFGSEVCARELASRSCCRDRSDRNSPA